MHNPGSDRALVFCNPHTSSRLGRRGQQQRGLSCPQPVVLWQRVPHGVNAALVVGVIVAIGGRGGAAMRLAELLAWGEEFDDRGQKIRQGG
jgi:hypothetical protein